MDPHRSEPIDVHALGSATPAARRRIGGRRIALGFVAAIVGGSFFLPALAGLAFEVGCGVAGVRAEQLEVTVDAWPPQEVALGRADRVRLSGRGLGYGEMSADLVDVTIHGLDIPGSRSGAVEASVDSATVAGTPITAIDVHGSSLSDMTFELRLSPVALLTLARRILAGEIDLLQFPAPDQLQVRVGPRVIAVRFHVDEVVASLTGLSVRGTASVAVT